MVKSGKLSTRDISKLLVKVAEDVQDIDPKLLSKELIEKCNILLRVAKHGIQTIAVMTVVAKMREMSGATLKKLPQIEVED